MTLHHASASSILDTIAMVEKYRLDIRTVTMGINLLGCRTPEEVYARCVSRAARLVEVCEGIEKELGIDDCPDGEIGRHASFRCWCFPSRGRACAGGR